MDNNTKIQIASGIDIMVAIFLLLTGIYVILFGLDYMDFWGLIPAMSYGMNPFEFMDLLPTIVVLLGFATLFYGIKRLIDDILSIVVKIGEKRGQPHSFQPPVQQQPPMQQMPQQNFQNQEFK